MLFTIDGLVIRETNVGEHDKLITLLTAERGKISVMAKGARSIKSKLLHISELYSYANYEIYEKGGYFWVRGGSLIESFYNLRTDIEKLFLAAYIADVACEVSVEEIECEELLRVTLNTFYALAQSKKPPTLIKAVYELRAASISGFMPEVSTCSVCHTNSASFMYLDVMNGKIICEDCRAKQQAAPVAPKLDPSEEYYGETNILLPISASVAAAVKYAMTSPLERMLAFELRDELELRAFSKVGEVYLLNHLERGFDSLNLYKSIL